MKILKKYSQKDAEKILSIEKPDILAEVEDSINNLDALTCMTKIGGESTNKGKLLFSPPTINKYFKTKFLQPNRWQVKQGEKYKEPRLTFEDGRFRRMDGLKDRVGLEIQFGKYAFMAYDIFSKFIIFKNGDILDFGIEIVLVQDVVRHASTGVSAFEQIMIDFEHRGEADIDIPVLVLGIGPDEQEWERVYELQDIFRTNPHEARTILPTIGTNDLLGTKPGPK